MSYHVSYLLLNAFFLGEDSVQGCKTPPRQSCSAHDSIPPQPFHTEIHYSDSHWTSRITDTCTDLSRASLHVKATPLSDSLTGDMQMLLMFTLFPSFRPTCPSPRYQSSSSAWLLLCTRHEREMGGPGFVDRVKSAAWLFTDSSKPAEERGQGHLSILSHTFPTKASLLTSAGLDLRGGMRLSGFTLPGLLFSGGMLVFETRSCLHLKAPQLFKIKIRFLQNTKA